jgi:integrase
VETLAANGEANADRDGEGAAVPPSKWPPRILTQPGSPGRSYCSTVGPSPAMGDTMRGHIRPCSYKKKDGTQVVRDDVWHVVIYEKRSGEQPRNTWHTVRGTRKDAEKQLTKLLRQKDTGEYVEPSRQTVGQYLEQWLTAVRPNIAAKTWQEYGGHLRRHVIPGLGRHRLDKLTPLAIQAFYARLQQEGRQNGEGGLSPQTVLHIHRILRKALQDAVDLEVLSRNPCAKVKPPQAQSREAPALDEEQTARVLEAARGTRMFIPVLLAASTGLRRGEILALSWTEVDLAAGTLNVRRSLEQTKDGMRFKQPKTSKSRRTVALPRFAVEELRRYKEEQAAARLIVGATYQSNGLVIAEEDGGPWKPDNFSREFIRFLKRTDVPRISFHGLRHSHVAMLIKQGTHLKTIADRMGHSTIVLTANTYGHLLGGVDQEAAERFDLAMRGRLGSGDKPSPEQ